MQKRQSEVSAANRLDQEQSSCEKGSGKVRASRKAEFIPEEVFSPSQAAELLLRDVNKLIFVQDFDLAFEILKEASRDLACHAEVLFRLVEVGTRLDREDEIESEFQIVLEKQPHHLPVTLARCLLAVRKEEKKNPEPSESLVNPSLNSAERHIRGAADGMDSASEIARLLPRSYFGLSSIESARRGYMVGNSLRVTRNPFVADDFVPEDPAEVSQTEFEKLNLLQDFGDVNATIASLSEEISGLILDFPENYAVWYVKGCVCELQNDLHEAVESWIQAHRRNSRSLAVLATLSELQQIGALPGQYEQDYIGQFEALDRFAIHGTYETHMELYREFLATSQFPLAIAALRTLADWMQRQRGEVPTEVEILCLLGAMNAHRAAGNSGAAENARMQAENLAISFKKSTENLEALAFVAQAAEQFGLPALSRMCYFSVLVHPNASQELIVKTAAHTVSNYASPALVECLKTAYRNHHGDAEIRFCQILCSLAVDDVPVKDYLERKNRIRELIQQEEIGEALTLLQQSVSQSDKDPEIHYYLAEIYSRLDASELAIKHFSMMFELDDLNVESILRYVHYLLKLKGYESASYVAAHLAQLGGLTDVQQGEIHWAVAASHFAQERTEDAGFAIQKALQFAPWNLNFLALAMRLEAAALSGDERSEIDALLTQFEDSQLGSREALSREFLKSWIGCGTVLVNKGLIHLPFLMAASVFRMHHREDEVVCFFCLASSAGDTRLATSRLMLLLREQDTVPSFAELAYCISRIYSLSGDWKLVGEWVDISLKSGLEEKKFRGKLFFVEALKCCFGETDYARSQSLLEAAVDLMENKEMHGEIGVLLGYLYLVQGDLQVGLDKMIQHLSNHPSIFELSLVVKGFERSGRPDPDDHLSKLLNLRPRNSLERQFLEEAFLVQGARRPGSSVSLTC